jgi:hypothetical protein
MLPQMLQHMPKQMLKQRIRRIRPEIDELRNWRACAKIRRKIIQDQPTVPQLRRRKRVSTAYNYGMASCALEGCNRPECQVCSVNSRFIVTPCRGHVDGEPCTKIAKHYPPCVSKRKAGRVEAAELKESKPVETLDGPRAAAQALAFQKRKREGAFRQQRG